MLNPNAKKWIRALRSGKYKQIRGQLGERKAQSEGFCCLGVACEVAIQSGINVKKTESHGILHYNKTGSLLPPIVKKWLGLKTLDGRFINKFGEQLTLTELNDDRKLSFNKIANAIVKNQKSLFKSNKTLSSKD